MTDWLNILQGASFVGLLIVTTVAGLQRGQVQNLKATIEGLRGDRDDLTARLDRRDEELADEKRQRQEERVVDAAEIAELRSSVETLRSTVTGETHLVAIEDVATHINMALTKHHTEAMERLARIEDRITEGQA